MLKITGVHTCSKCGKEFKWEYQPSASFSGGNIGSADEFDFSVKHAKRVNSLSLRYAELSLECKYCGYYDRFTVDTLSNGEVST